MSIDGALVTKFIGTALWHWQFRPNLTRTLFSDHYIRVARATAITFAWSFDFGTDGAADKYVGVGFSTSGTMGTFVLFAQFV